jgi:hypothetical protein
MQHLETDGVAVTDSMCKLLCSRIRQCQQLLFELSLVWLHESVQTSSVRTSFACPSTTYIMCA